MLTSIDCSSYITNQIAITACSHQYCLIARYELIWINEGGEKVSVLKYNPIIAAIAGGFEKDNNLQNVSQVRVITLVSAGDEANTS